MVALSFLPRFAPLVTARTKVLTLRKPRRAPARLPRVGETVSLWTNWRTPEATCLGTARTVVRCTVLFDAKGPRTPLDLVVLEDEPGTNRVLAQLGAGADVFARADGFENWAEAWAWHEAHADRTRSWTLLERELVGWDLVPAEAAAELLAA